MFPCTNTAVILQSVMVNWMVNVFALLLVVAPKLPLLAVQLAGVVGIAVSVGNMASDVLVGNMAIAVSVAKMGESVAVDAIVGRRVAVELAG